MRSRNDASLEQLVADIDESLGKKYKGEEFISKAEKIFDEHGYVLGDGYAKIETIEDGIMQREITEVYEKGETNSGRSLGPYEDTIVLYLRGRRENQEAGAEFTGMPGSTAAYGFE